jgi:hypothetical protein
MCIREIFPRGRETRKRRDGNALMPRRIRGLFGTNEGGVVAGA